MSALDDVVRRCKDWRSPFAWPSLDEDRHRIAMAAEADLANIRAENERQAALLRRAESIIHVAPVLGAAKWIEDYHGIAPTPAAKPSGPFLCIECKRAPVAEADEMCDLCDQESADHEFP